MGAPDARLTEAQVQSFEHDVIDVGVERGNEYAQAWSAKLKQAQTLDEQRAVIQQCLAEARERFSVFLTGEGEEPPRIQEWESWQQLVEDWRKRQPNLG